MPDGSEPLITSITVIEQEDDGETLADAEARLTRAFQEIEAETRVK